MFGGLTSPTGSFRVILDKAGSNSERSTHAWRTVCRASGGLVRVMAESAAHSDPGAQSCHEALRRWERRTIALRDHLAGSIWRDAA